MNFPMDPLPDAHVSMEQLVLLQRQASRVLNTPASQAEFIRTVQYGRCLEPRSSLILDVNHGNSIVMPDSCTFGYALASIIGITDIFPYTTELSVFTIPTAKDTLRSGELKYALLGNPVCYLLFPILRF